MQQTGPRRRAVAGVAAAMVVTGALTAGAWYAGAFGPRGSQGPASAAAPPPATAVVVRGDITAVTPVAATLGYGGSVTVRGQGGGTLTWLPSPGQVIRSGQVLYRIGLGTPVVLLRGSFPDIRTMSEGITGRDVTQLNHDLVALGYAKAADVSAVGWDYYSWATAAGVRVLEEHAGVTSPPGSLGLGQVVFGPAAIRVTQETGSLGGPASGPVLTATSDRRVVTIALDVSYESLVKAGDQVTVTLPDGSTTPGVVSSVGKVATTTSGSGGGSTTTIPVQVRLTDPAAAGSLDEAPVTVNITTATARGVLAVPVTALQARPGGYDVEVAGPGNTRRWVPVTVGSVFDDATGLVEVSGALTPGQRVIVASS